MSQHDEYTLYKYNFLNKYFQYNLIGGRDRKSVNPPRATGLKSDRSITFSLYKHIIALFQGPGQFNRPNSSKKAFDNNFSQIFFVPLWYKSKTNIFLN